MAILTGPEIVRQVAMGRISIDPFDEGAVQPNSVDVRLGPKLLIYRPGNLDPRADNPTWEIDLPGTGYVLRPGEVYLGHTVEQIYSRHYAATLEGKSSLGRLGLSCHLTAGFIDAGFQGQVTLEITCVRPVIVYPGMWIAQLCWAELVGDVRLYTGRYQGNMGAVASRAHLGGQQP